MPLGNVRTGGAKVSCRSGDARYLVIFRYQDPLRTCCHIRIERITGQENNLPAMAKTPFIHGSEFDSDGEDFMPTPPAAPFKKVPQIGFGMVVLNFLTTLGVSLWGIHHTVGILESVIHAVKASDELFRVKA